MRWLLMFAVGLSSLLVPVAMPGTAHACSCIYAPDDPRIREHVSHAAGVFTGTATKQNINGDTAYYEFDVREVFAGEIGSRTVVATSTQGPACGTGFEVGTEYLVFASTAHSRRTPWSDSSCSASTVSSDNRARQAAIEVYGPPQAPDADQRSVSLDDIGTPWAWWAAGITGAAVAGAFVTGWLRRRRQCS